MREAAVVARPKLIGVIGYQNELNIDNHVGVYNSINFYVIYLYLHTGLDSKGHFLLRNLLFKS